MSLFDPKPKVDNSGLANQVEELARSVKSMEGTITQLGQSIQTLHTNQTYLNDQMKGLATPKGDAPTNDSYYQDVATHDRFKALHEYTEEELGQMTPQQIYQVQAEHTQRQIADEIKKNLGPLADQFKTFQSSHMQDKAKTALERLKSERGEDGKLLRPDVDDYMDVMRDMARDPNKKGLGLEELYILSKSQKKRSDPAGYKAIQDKHFPKPAKDASRGFGGFLSSTMPKSDVPGDLSVKDAAHTAAAKVLEDSGGLPEVDGFEDFSS